MAPAVDLIKHEFKDKKIGVIVPIYRKATNLRKRCHFYGEVRKKTLESSQLPDKVTGPTKYVLKRPTEWT